MKERGIQNCWKKGPLLHPQQDEEYDSKNYEHASKDSNEEVIPAPERVDADY